MDKEVAMAGKTPPRVIMHQTTKARALDKPIKTEGAVAIIATRLP